MSPFRKFLRRFRHNEDGSILTEIAISIPVYVIILTGVVEVGNYLLTHLKLQHTVVSVSDLITRDEDISEGVITDIFESVPHIMAPFDDNGRTLAVITAISQTEDEPASIYWQRSGGGTLSAASEIGVEGEQLDALPGGLTLRDDETILAAEIFYSYEPLFFDMVETQTIRKTSYFRPRIGALQEIDP